AYLKAVDLGWVLEEEVFKNAPIMSAEGREALRDLILNKMQERTLEEWMQVYVTDGNIAAEPFLFATEGMKHPQFVHNGHEVEIEDPRVGRLTTVGLLARLSETPGKVGGAAPYLGEHTSEILRSVGSGRSGALPTKVETANGRTQRKAALTQPLSGI